MSSAGSVLDGACPTKRRDSGRLLLTLRLPAFVADPYADLDEHGATVLATPFSRVFVDVNRRLSVVRTHTMREQIT